MSDSDDDSDETPTRPQPRPLAKKPVAAKKEEKPKVLAKVKVKAELSPSILAATTEENGLPEFARAAWSGRFLPTWYHYVGTRLGWEVCALGDEVKVIQSVVDKCYPGTTYRVKKGCPIYTTVITVTFPSHVVS